MPITRVNGVNIYYEVAGSGHGVIFVHAHNVDCRLWDKQVEAVSRSYTMVRYDFRGHGRSEAPPTGYHIPFYAQDLRALIQHLGLRKPSIVGLSMGGNVALEYALTWPNEISTLTMADSGLLGFEETQMQETMAKRQALVRDRGIDTTFVRAALMSNGFKGVVRDPANKALIKDMLEKWSGMSYRDKATYPPPETTQAERVKGLNVPLLVMVGEHDTGRFQRIADYLAANVRVVRKVVVPGAYHFAPLETPDVFNDILLDFLGGAVGKALI
ncbi:MAG: alpha/beta fold hydrolase [Chloroflexi bacterium]|nr:alpha/beta fold hydrolase [Chloroflexota bacterium]